jgi:ketosteroid isomerase-like protein
MTQIDETADVRKLIEQKNAHAIRCYASGDVDSLVSMVSEDCCQMPPNNPALIGKKAIRDFWSQALQWGKWEFTFETQKVDARTDMAVERGKYILRFTAGEKAPPGVNSFEDRGNYLVHWRRENDGEWRAVADAPVSELPYPGKL